MTLSADGLDQQERRVVENVEKHGTHVFQISGDREDDGFSYTIGLLYRYDHPELIVFGQKPDWQHWLLNALRDEVQAGARFEPDTACTTVLDGFRLTFKAVPVEQLPEYFGWALWFYRDVAPDASPLRALQVVWPDLADVLPWEPGYRAGYRQPILDGTPSTAPANRFPISLEAGVFTCERVMSGAPVLYVVREGQSEDGSHEDWVFLCGGMHDEPLPGDGPQWVHLRHVLERDEGLNVLADLEANWYAERTEASAPWIREPSEPEPDRKADDP